MKEIQSASEIEGLQLYEMTIRTPRSYNDDEKNAVFIAEATFHSSATGMSELKIKLDGELSKNIVRALAPVLAQSAANAAKKLADDATNLANALSDTMIKQINAPKSE